MKRDRASRVTGTEVGLLLRAACGTGKDAAGSWRRWREGRALEAAPPLAIRLLPFIHSRRDELGVEAGDRGFLEGLYRYVWMRNQAMLNGLGAFLGLAREQGIEVMLIKGAAVLEAGYRDAGLCYMADSDVMVRPDGVPRLVDAALACGWKAARGTVALRSGSWFQDERLVGTGGTLVEVHWDLLRHPVPSVDESGTWRAARRVVVRGVECKVPSPECLLLQTLVRGVSGRGERSLRWMLDVHVLLREGGIHWERLLEEAARRRTLRFVQEALQRYEGVVPDCLPAAVWERLARHRPDARERAAYIMLTDDWRWVSPASAARVVGMKLGFARAHAVQLGFWKGLKQYLGAGLASRLGTFGSKPV